MKKNIGLKIIIGILAFIVIVFAAAWLAPKKGLIKRVEQEVYSASGLKLSIGNIRPAIFGLSLTDIHLQAENQDLLQFKMSRATAKIKLIPLLSKKIVLSDLIIVSPHLNMDLSYFNENEKEQEQADLLSKQKSETDFANIDIKHLSIKDMKINILDQQKPMLQTTVDRQSYAIKTQSLDFFEIAGDIVFEEILYNTPYGYLGRSLKPKINISGVYDLKNQKAELKKFTLNDQSLNADLTAQAELKENPVLDLKFNVTSDHLKQLIAILPSSLFGNKSIQSTDGQLSISAEYKGGADFAKADYAAKIKLDNGLARYKKDIRDIFIEVSLDEKNISVDALKAKTDESMFDLKGRLSNYNNTKQAGIDFTGQYNLNFDELQQLQIYPQEHKLGGSASGNFKINQTIASPSMTGQSQFKNVSYVSRAEGMENLKINNLQGHLKLNKNSVNLDINSMKLNDDSLSVNGKLNNVMAYFLADEALNYDVSVNAEFLDLDKLLPQGEKTKSDEPVDFSSIKKINGISKLSCKNLLYDGLNFKDVDAQLYTQNGAVELKNFSTNVFSGALKTKFKVDLGQKQYYPYEASVDVDQVKIDEFLDYAKAFFPIKINKLTKFGGQLFSQIKSSGKLNASSLSPDVDSISFEGPVKILEGYLKQSSIQKQIAKFVKRDSLKSVDFKSWNQYIKFNKGIFEVDKLSLNSLGLDITGSGTQSLAGQVDYDFKLKLPRKDIEKTLPALAKLSGSGDNVTIPIELKGSLSDMRVVLDDSNIKESVTKRIEKAVEKKVEKQIESKVNKKTDAVKEKARDAVKDKLKDLGF